ncbi:monovalent cation:proton antiporter-2 (CPA2) family protein [Maritalea mediterranea]|uniref:Monovalent cation:proton antiporter-2 (CPA2) family protein n=1 Tax=Maritalea mediterranea TaxID=2909667 RepID=A0ABS9EC16_9HYPH|nr:monovalent cation:proton antiporter-2 (CPA2) family protein [Maritalea mediterranea]MCF4099434.1 monovalent cation:proton antiporter-2 (CPA2) family protein [Maritalea mediterranea]
MTTEFLLITFALFLSGAICVPLASRFGLGSVLGYLIAGILVGPILHQLNVDITSLQHFAEFGVVMMLFIVGLEMSPKSLWEMRSQIFVLGGLQVSLSALAIAAIALAFGVVWQTAIAIGLIFALSSTAIVNQTLNEKGLLRSDGGQASFSTLLFQDVAVIPMLALLPLLALPELADHAHHDDGHGAGFSLVAGLNGWQTALVNFAAIALVVGGGIMLTNPIFRYVAKAKLRELLIATALMLVVGIALLMSLVGLSPALGTFLAGVVMANSEYRHELESDIDPFKGLFLGVFFITIGAGISFGYLADNFLILIGLTVGMIAVKMVVMFGLAQLFGLKGEHKWLYALGLAQAGEFGFVLLSFAVSNFILSAELSQLLLMVVALSMLITPFIFIFYDRVIAPHYAQGQVRPADTIEATNGIIIAGHGRFGGIVNRVLRAAGFAPTVVDYSSDQLDMLRKFGLKVYFGDATRPDLLHAAGIEHAKILVIAIDDKHAITDLAKYVIKNNPHVHVIARAVDRNHVYDLWAYGCRDIIRETYDSSMRTARSSLEALGLDRNTAQHLVDEFDSFDRKTMIELAEHWQVEVPATENEQYMGRIRESLDHWEEQLIGRMKKIIDKDQDTTEKSSSG